MLHGCDLIDDRGLRCDRVSALVVLMLLLLHHAAPTNAFGGGQTCLVTGTSRS